MSLPANLAIPLTVKSRTPPAPVIDTVSPTCTVPSFAERRSMTTSLPDAGALPSANCHGDCSASMNTPPYLGGPTWPRTVPSLVAMRAKPCTSPYAALTPGWAATSSTMEMDRRSRLSSPKSPSMTLLERTNASVPA